MESYSLLFASGVLCLILARLFPPTKVYLLWALVLISYVLWPFEAGKVDTRIALNLPLEYVPLLMVFGAGWFSGVFRGRPFLPSRPRYLSIFALGIIFYGASSFGWVVNHRLWLQYFIMWLVYLFSFFAMVGSFSGEAPERFLKFLDQFFLILTAYALLIVGRHFISPVQPYAGGDYLDFAPIIRYRISQVLTILPYIPVAIRMYFATNRPVYLVFLGVGSSEILLSLSRAGIVGWIAVLVLSAVIGGRELVQPKNRRRILAVVLTVTLAVAISVELGGERFIQRVLSILYIGQIWFGNLSGPQALSEVGAGGRSILVREALRIFLERPWLGTGVGNYLEYVQSGPVLPASPHNFYLTYLSEFGVLGFVPLLAFVLYLMYFLWYRSAMVGDIDQRVVLQGFIAANVAFLVIFLASDFMTTPYIWFFWGLSIAYGLSARTRSLEDRGEGGRASPQLKITM